MIPLTPSFGETSKVTPLQVVVLIGSNVPPGLSVITTVKFFPIQLPDKGSTEYVAVWTTDEVFLSFPEIKFCCVPDAPPVIDIEIIGTFQVYSVPSGTMPLVLFTGEITKGTSLHIALVITVISAVGLTVTVTVNPKSSEQLTEVGVT
jgi:hypothetical protein